MLLWGVERLIETDMPGPVKAKSLVRLLSLDGVTQQVDCSSQDTYYGRG